MGLTSVVAAGLPNATARLAKRHASLDKNVEYPCQQARLTVLILDRADFMVICVLVRAHALPSGSCSGSQVWRQLPRGPASR